VVITRKCTLNYSGIFSKIQSNIPTN
jgi:hypothetical protein